MGAQAARRPLAEAAAKRTLEAEQRVRGRAAQAAGSARVPVRRRASNASVRARLRGALDESQRQREQIAWLREELALAHGRVRELELDRRLRRT